MDPDVSTLYPKMPSAWPRYVALALMVVCLAVAISGLIVVNKFSCERQIDPRTVQHQYLVRQAYLSQQSANQDARLARHSSGVTRFVWLKKEQDSRANVVIYSRLAKVSTIPTCAGLFPSDT